MLYPSGVIEDIRTQNDIVSVISEYTSLTQKGGSYMGLCPFHKEKTPSFSVSADKQLYNCFGCGASGNVVTFIMQKENYDFPDAIKYLASRVNYRLPEPSQSAEYQRLAELRNTLSDIHTKAARYFYDTLLSEKGAKAVLYLNERKVSQWARKRFGLGFGGNGGELYAFLSSLGYSDELLLKSGLVIADKRGGYFDRFTGRLMFPIFDVYGKVIGFGGRILDKGEPKYLNSPETMLFSKSKSLYGINYARQSKSKTMILVEGYMDVIALHENGFSNAVASLGTAFNTDHASVLAKYCENAVLLFDSDAAGEKAVLRASPVLTQAGLHVRVLQLTGAKDPDEFLKKFGKEAFESAISSAESAVSFRLKCLKKGYNISDPIEKSRFVKDASEVIAALTSSVEREIYGKELAALSGISENAVASEVDKLSDKKTDEIKTFRYKNKPVVYSADKLEKQRDEARRSVLAAMSSSSGLAKKIIKHVNFDEFVTPCYIELYNLLSEVYAGGGTVVPAELICRFETLDEQKIVSAIFSQRQVYDNEEAYINSLNRQISIVKLEYINACIEKLPRDAEYAALSSEKQKECDKTFIFLTEKKRILNPLVSNNFNWLE